jgi:hypothetical protein
MYIYIYILKKKVGEMHERNTKKKPKEYEKFSHAPERHCAIVLSQCEDLPIRRPRRGVDTRRHAVLGHRLLLGRPHSKVGRRARRQLCGHRIVRQALDLVVVAADPHTRTPVVNVNFSIYIYILFISGQVSVGCMVSCRKKRKKEEKKEKKKPPKINYPYARAKTKNQKRKKKKKKKGEAAPDHVPSRAETVACD